MKWEVSGIDPSKSKLKKARVIQDTIDAVDIIAAVRIFCGKYPNIVQLMIVRTRDGN